MPWTEPVQPVVPDDKDPESGGGPLDPESGGGPLVGVDKKKSVSSKILLLGCCVCCLCCFILPAAVYGGLVVVAFAGAKELVVTDELITLRLAERGIEKKDDDVYVVAFQIDTYGKFEPEEPKFPVMKSTQDSTITELKLLDSDGSGSDSEVTVISKPVKSWARVVAMGPREFKYSRDGEGFLTNYHAVEEFSMAEGVAFLNRFFIVPSCGLTDLIGNVVGKKDTVSESNTIFPTPISTGDSKGIPIRAPLYATQKCVTVTSIIMKNLKRISKTIDLPYDTIASVFNGIFRGFDDGTNSNLNQALCSVMGKEGNSCGLDNFIEFLQS